MWERNCWIINEDKSVKVEKVFVKVSFELWSWKFVKTEMMLKRVTGSAVINHLKQDWCHYLQIFKWVFRTHLSGWDCHLVTTHKFRDRNRLCVCLMINKWVVLSYVLPWAYARKPREINITIQTFISCVEFLTVMQWGMRNERLLL